MSEEKTNADVATLPFEAAMKELEAIVAQLERGDVPLEKSIEIYTRGEALKARCDALLKQAEARIERITLGADGKPTGATPLDVDN
nr:exodeoxyribonuclease VII small subunit [Bosea sp. REN20]